MVYRASDIYELSANSENVRAIQLNSDREEIMSENIRKPFRWTGIFVAVFTWFVGGIVLSGTGSKRRN